MKILIGEGHGPAERLLSGLGGRNQGPDERVWEMMDRGSWMRTPREDKLVRIEYV